MRHRANRHRLPLHCRASLQPPWSFVDYAVNSLGPLPFADPKPVRIAGKGEAMFAEPMPVILVLVRPVPVSAGRPAVSVKAMAD